MALTRITKGVIKPNENYDTHNINSTGIVTATKFVGPFDNINVSGAATFTGNVTIGGTLTYEDVTNIDSVGIITARDGIHVGAGVSVVGILTASVIKSTNLTSGRVVFTTAGGQLDNSGNLAYDGTVLTSGTPVDINSDLDVDGHTNLDNVSIAGVTTFSGNIGGTANFNDIDVDGHTNLDNVSVSGITTFSGIVDAVNTPASIRVAQDIQHKGDANTKISFPANDEISLDTSGHDRIYIKSDGKIGMGTVTPAVDIHHFSDGLNGNGVRLENREGYVSLTNDANGLYIDAQYVNFRDRAGSTSYASINSSGNLSVFKDLDVDGHTNLDNVSIAGVSTFSGGAGAITIAADSDIRFTNTSNWSGEHAGKIQYFGNKLYLQGGSNGHQLRNQSGGTVFEIGSTGSCAGMDLTLAQDVTLNGDIDVDGHTNLDNVSIAGVTTANTLIIGDTSDTQTSTSDNRIRIGNNQDLQIFHGPNNSYIRNTTNSFNIEQYANATLDIFSNHDVRLRVNGGELAVDCSHNQGVDLYYDASVHTSPKISTRSNGAYVNGLLEILRNASQSTSTPLLLQNSAAAGTGSNPDVVKLAFGSQGSVKASIRAAVYGEGHMAFHTNNDTEKVRITAAGRVGIMETSPDRSLHIKDSGIIKLENTSTGGWAGLEWMVSSGTNNYDAYMGLQDSDGLFFIDNNSNGIDFCIKQNGRIGMGGETNPIATLTINKGSTGQNTTHTDGELLRLEGYDSTNSRHGIGFGRYNGGQNGYKPAAFIGAATGTWSSYTNCHLVFSTRNSTGDDDPTERLRITNDGKVVAGSSGAGYDERLQAHAAGTCLGLNSTSGAAELRFYESGAGRFRMKTLNGNPGIIFEDWTNGETRAEIAGDGDFKIHDGTRNWSTIAHRCSSGRVLRKHIREFNSGSSATVHNLIRVRRHYWGWGHYKFTIKRVYYSGIAEDVYYLNGHGRDDGSYNPSYSIGQRQYNGHGSNFGYSGRITITTPSGSSPGSDTANYVDVQLQCPAYMWFVVEVEAAAAGYSLDTSSLGSDTYALHQ